MNSPSVAIVLISAFSLTLLTDARPQDRPMTSTSSMELNAVLPPRTNGFEAFYARDAYGVPNGSARPAFGHGSFYQYRNPALVDAKNSPAYGFRFDGRRRFNFD